MLEEKRFCAIVYDLTPGYHKERKVLRRLCDYHLLKELYSDVVGNNNVTEKDCLHFVARLRDEGFSDEWIGIVCDIFDIPYTQKPNTKYTETKYTEVEYAKTEHTKTKYTEIKYTTACG